MASITETTRYADTGPGALTRLRVRFAAWRHRRAAFVSVRNELGCLTDRELNDIGIARSQIDAIAREAAQNA
ncbi:MAG: DUF1127 domain-containing protein [Qingshengfaniella sp.]